MSCEYCRDEKCVMHEDDTHGTNHICWGKDGILYVFVAREMGHTQEYKIKYCPMCGQELSK